MLKSLFHGLTLSVLIVSGLLFITSTPVSAASGSWYLANTIIVDGQEYIDGKLGDTPNYYLVGAPEGCRNEIKDFSNDLSSATLITRTYNDITDSCSSNEETVSLSNNIDGPKTLFRWINADTLEYYDGGQYKMSSENDKIFVDQATESCRNTLEIGDNLNEGTLIVRATLLDECREAERIDVVVLNENNNASNPGTGQDDGAQENTEENDSCEENGGVLGFIICAAVEGFDALLGLVDRIIISQLTIDPDRYNNDAMRTAAGVVRNISYVIMVPILLVMVIGTALNFSFLDAYTVKRAMPRMLVAIIFITLSWPLLTLLVEATEVIAAGLNGIITSPFKEGGGDLSMQEIFGPGLLTSVASAAVAGVGLIILLVLFGGTLAGMAAIGFVILLARQIFIVALMIVAPLAMLSWIFPGNDKLWKAWWGTFSKLLLMYPLIIGILAMGRVFAKIIHPSADSDIGNVGSEEIIEPVAAFIVYFIPYAFIPFAFKTAGGIFGQVTGALNDRSKGFFDRQREKRGDRVKRMQNQGMLRDDHTGKLGGIKNRGAKVFNKSASLYTNNPLDSAAMSKRGRSGGLGEYMQSRSARVGSQITGAAFQDTQEMSKALQENGITVDQALRVLMGRNSELNEEGKKEGLDFSKGIHSRAELQKAVEILGKSDKASNRVAASQLNQASQFVLEGHKSEKYGRGNLQGAALFGLASQGFADNEDIAVVANRAAKSGSPELGSVIANQASYMNYSKGRLDSKPTYGVQFDAASGEWTYDSRDESTMKQQESLVAGTKQQEFVQLKGAKPVKNLKKAMINVATGAMKDVERENPVTGEMEKVKGADGKVLQEPDKLLRQTMAQNIATSALSSTDAAAKAEWRRVFAELKGIEDASSPIVDVELRRSMYGDIDPNSPEGQQMREMMQRQQEVSGGEDGN